MKNPALKALAIPHSAFDGAVTFHILPYTPMAYQDTLRQLSDASVLTLRDGQYVGSFDTVYWLTGIAHTVDIEFKIQDDTPNAVKALQLYWQNRPMDACESWQFARAVLEEGTVEVWNDAYEATRGGTATEAERDTGKDETDPKG